MDRRQTQSGLKNFVKGTQDLHLSNHFLVSGLGLGSQVNVPNSLVLGNEPVTTAPTSELASHCGSHVPHPRPHYR